MFCVAGGFGGGLDWKVDDDPADAVVFTVALCGVEVTG